MIQRNLKFSLLLLIMIVLSNCSTTMSHESVKEIAEPELDCAPSKITLKSVGNRWYANGCGKKATFFCSGSNFLTKGTCMKESVSAL